VKEAGSDLHTLIDNTAIHRLGKVLDDGPGSHQSISDIFNIFHFAENIMFSESLAVSGFETPDSYERSSDIISRLDSCIGNHNESIIDRIDVSLDSFKNICDISGNDLRAKIFGVSDDSGIFKLWDSYINQSSYIDGFSKPPIASWLNNQTLDIEEATEYLNRHKAGGSFLYALSTNEILYKELKSKRGKLFDDGFDYVSGPISIILITSIMQQIASSSNRIYSPAPQRGKVLSIGSDIFRNRLNVIIGKLLSDNEENANNANTVLKRFRDNEKLDLPYFALHLLSSKKKNDIKSAYDVLELAMNIRSDSEVVEIREVLIKFSKSEYPARVVEMLGERIRERVKGEHTTKAILGAGMNGVPLTVGQVSSTISEPLKKLVKSFAPGKVFLSVVDNMAKDREFDRKIMELMPYAVSSDEV